MSEWRSSVPPLLVGWDIGVRQRVSREARHLIGFVPRRPTRMMPVVVGVLATGLVV